MLKDISGYTNPLFRENFVGIAFHINEVIQQKTIEPESLFSALAKIGGVLGLMRIFSLFRIFHEIRFEDQLNKELMIKEDLDQGSLKINEKSQVSMNFAEKSDVILI